MTIQNNTLAIRSTIAQSWKLSTNGVVQLAIWLVLAGGFLLGKFYFVISKITTHNHNSLLIDCIIHSMLFAPFLTGAILIAIQHCRGNLISYKSGFIYFKYWKYWPRLAIANVIIFLTATPLSAAIGFLMVGHYHSTEVLASTILYYFCSWIFFLLISLTLPLIVDKNMNIYTAFKESIKKIFPYLHKVIAIHLLSFMIIGLFYPFFSLGGPVGKLGAVIVLYYAIPYISVLNGFIYCQLIDKKL